jgi:hypothetical protein
MRRVVSLLVVNALVFVAAAELIALAVFGFQTGWLYYVDPYVPQIERVAEPAGGRVTSVALHPYFGPTHQPGIPFDMPAALRAEGSDAPTAGRAGGGLVAVPPLATNNFGFTSTRDYPVARTNDRQFLVGIFGGSVAAWFCQVGAQRLVVRLMTAPALRDRDIVPICFAHEGYKQPQQLLVLGYFLSIGQELDLAVNIDGFNEVALSPLNDARGSDISMPSVMHMDPLVAVLDQSSLTPEKVEALARIQGYRRRADAAAARANLAWSAALYFLHSRVHAVLDRQYRAEVQRFDALPSASETSMIRVTPKVRPRGETELLEDIARGWLRASVLMGQMLSSRGARYVHVLQPNQYFTTRPFAAGEAEVALLDASPFKAGAQKGYPALERAAASGEFTKAGVTFVDGIHLFDAERAPVYIDNCCHYTRRGYEILADAIASAAGL